MSKPNKYNASGMGANPKLNTAQLYNGPPQSNGPQSGKVRLEGEGSRYIGNACAAYNAFQPAWYYRQG